jgi:hypothetical protein
MAVGSAIMEQFMNVVESLGEAIYNAINNPQEALKRFGELIKENIINRFEGMMELIPAIGKAVSLLFEGEFAEAGKVAFDAVAKVTTGIEDASGKIAGLISETTALVNAGIANGKKLADLQAKIDKDERALVTQRAKTNLEVSKIRAEAIELEGEARKAAIKEAIALEEQLSAKEVELAKTRQEQAALNVQANGDDKEALNELAAAQAAVFAAEQAAFDNTLRFRKELESLDEADEKRADDKAKKRADDLKKQHDEELKAVADRNKAIAEQNAKDAEIVKEAFDEALVIHNEYVQGLINNKKRELLEGLINQEEYNRELADLQIAADETLLAIKEEFGARDLETEAKILDAKIQLKQKDAETTQMTEQAKLTAIQSTLGQVAGLFNRNSIAFKALASAQVAIQTYQSAQAVFTGMTTTIPGPVGVALGIAGAAAAILNGLKNLAAVNSIKLPKLASGGVIDIGGKRHAHGGEVVTVGGHPVAEVEQGEKMVVLKRGAPDSLIRNLSSINQMIGGRDFYNDRTPRYKNADGGFVARSAANQVSSFQTQSLAEDIKNMKIYLQISDLEDVQRKQNTAKVTSELS